MFFMTVHSQIPALKGGVTSRRDGKGTALTKPPFEEMDIRTPYMRLAAKRWGPKDGLPVLALHGWLDNANSFDRLAPLLPDLHLVCLDLPGHGMSEHRPASMRYHYTDYVDEVVSVADALQWKQFCLLGHSMGAGIGCLAASAFPDRIAQLILIEGMGAVTGDLGVVPKALRRSIEAMRPNPQKKADAYHDLALLVRARTAAGDIRHSSAEILVRRAVKRSGDGFVWQSDRRLIRPYPQYFTNDVMLAFLQGITAPVLLITAEDGTLRKRPYFKSRCDAIEDLQMVTLPGHHHLHLDNPAPVAEAVCSFLDGCASQIGSGGADE
jgi:pimeloyl-ACP methyl ester carboxylesterase